MKTAKGTALMAAGVVAAIAAVACGDTINTLSDGWAMSAYVFVSLVLLLVALILCALGLNEENKYEEIGERRKIKRVAHHTNEWRDAQ